MNKKLSGALLILLLLCFLTFLIYAIYFNAFGANAQTSMSFFHISEAQQGLIMTVQSIGCVVMTVLLALFGERINKLHGLMFGLSGMGLAGLAIGTMTLYLPEGSGYGLMLAYSLIGGIGYISIDLLMNGLIADIYPDRKSTLLPYVHAFYGGGAMLAPLFVTLLADPAKPASFAMPYLVLGILSMLTLLVGIIVTKKVTPQTPYADMSELRARAIADPIEIFRDKRAWLFFLSCLFYLIFQTGMSAWLPQFVRDEFGLSYSFSNTMLTLYFLGALIIRFLSPVVYRKISVKNFFILSNTVSAVIFAIFLFVPLPTAIRCALLVLLGLLQGTSVPALVILCCDAFPTRTASASAAINLAISLAALIAPVGIGRLIEASGYYLPLVLMIVSLLLSVGALILIREKAAEQN